MTQQGELLLIQEQFG
uniref:Uncharacterized protein n=1 Tax=Anguilla anguilla TaxID=7936 RepID=A0A0E9RAZ8_ANGAN